MAQVIGNRLADLVGQGKIVAYSSFGTHVQHRGSPVNVIELEKGDFAQTKSQSCKHQQHGVVAAAHGAGAIDAGQQPVNVIGRNRTRNAVHRPVGDDRHGGDQIRHVLVSIPHVMQKGAQRGGHDLGALLVHPRRHVLNEAHDIARAQVREGHLTRAKAMLKESANKRHVAQDRCRSQTAGLAQMSLVGQHTTLDLRLGMSRNRLGGDHRFGAQVTDEMPQRRRVTRVKSLAASAASQILPRMLGADAAQLDLLLLEPSAETGGQQNPSTDRRTGIPLSDGSVCKSLQPRYQWAFRHV